MRNPRLLLVAQSLLALALLAAWLAFVDLSPVAARLAAAPWTIVGLALGLGVLASLIRAARWQLLLRPIARVPLRGVAPIAFASTLVNFLLPLRTGELARSLLLKQRHGVTIPGSLASLAVDRAFDLAAVLAVAACGLISRPEAADRWSKWILVGVALLLGLAAIVFVASRGATRPLHEASASALPAQLRLRIRAGAQRFLAGLSMTARSPRTLATAFGLTLLALGLDALAFYGLFSGVGGRADPGLVVLGYTLFVLTFLVPAAPGYVGTAEALGTLVFVTLGLPVDLASSAILLTHATNAVLVLALGVVGFGWMGPRPLAAIKGVLAGSTVVADGTPEALAEPPA